MSANGNQIGGVEINRPSASDAAAIAAALTFSSCAKALNEGYALGMTFAFNRNRLVGSYRFLSATSRA